MIRAEEKGDAAAIAALITAAFTGHPHSDGGEAGLVTRLRAEGALTLSLLLEAQGALIGHIAFSPVRLGGAPGWFGLGPLAIHPDHQRQGHGQALVRAGLAALAAQGAAGVVVLGAPAYYGRFGFRAGLGPVLPGFAPAHFMALALTDAPMPQGPVSYHPAFGA